MFWTRAKPDLRPMKVITAEEIEKLERASREAQEFERLTKMSEEEKHSLKEKENQ